MSNIEEQARAIVQAIYADLDDRRGCLDDVDDDVREEMQEAWVVLVHKVLESRWQPIETAPKDGTRVLLYGRSNGRGWERPDIGWFRDGVWWTAGLTPGRASHWQPLPEAPK